MTNKIQCDSFHKAFVRFCVLHFNFLMWNDGWDVMKNCQIEEQRWQQLFEYNLTTQKGRGIHHHLTKHGKYNKRSIHCIILSDEKNTQVCLEDSKDE